MYFIENMARSGRFTQILLALATYSLASVSIQVSPSYRAAGVFMLIDGGKYTFNFTAARAACLFLNGTIATIGQMERAVQHGLETCKFGWTAEQIAVIPRLTADKNCGKGKTGVVTWLATANTKFGVFCFNATDTDLLETTARPQGSTFSATLTERTRSSTPVAPLLRTTAKSPPAGDPRTKSPERVTSAFTLQAKHSTASPPPLTSTAPKTSYTHISTSPSHLLTSKPTVITSTFSTTVPSSSLPASESAKAPPVSPIKPSLGDVPTAIIILCIILLLLTAAGILWYYKLNIFTFLPQGQQKDDIETEMWKHTDSEMDLHSQDELEEEGEEQKYSSDITLCVNSDINTNSSE